MGCCCCCTNTLRGASIKLRIDAPLTLYFQHQSMADIQIKGVFESAGAKGGNAFVRCDLNSAEVDIDINDHNIVQAAHIEAISDLRKFSSTITPKSNGKGNGKGKGGRGGGSSGNRGRNNGYGNGYNGGGWRNGRGYGGGRGRGYGRGRGSGGGGSSQSSGNDDP